MFICCLAVIRAQSWRGRGDGTLETARRTTRMVVVATPLLKQNQEKKTKHLRFSQSVAVWLRENSERAETELRRTIKRPEL